MTSYGRAGGSLDEATFAVSVGAARAGRRGEILTALTLDKLASERGFTVLHDLRIPGSTANIDHVVVSGDKVWVIDSKLWKPGIYVTFRGRTYFKAPGSWFTRAAHADKRGVPLAQTRLDHYLAMFGARMQRPIMVIHSSRTRKAVRIWAYRPASPDGFKTRAVHPTQLSFPAQPASARIVAELARLLN